MKVSTSPITLEQQSCEVGMQKCIGALIIINYHELP